MTWAAVGIGGATAIAGALDARKKRKAAEKAAKAQQPLIDQQTELSKTLLPYATGFFSRAQQAYDPAAAYYHSVASGDRNRILQTLSPQLSNINSKYGSLIQASRELNPRSGASASFNNELAFRSADEKQALINSERSGAYGKLAEMVGTAGNLGGTAAGYGMRANEGASKSGYDLYGFKQNERESYLDLANTLAEIYGMGKGKGGTTSTSTTTTGNPWEDPP